MRASCRTKVTAPQGKPRQLKTENIDTPISLVEKTTVDKKIVKNQSLDTNVEGAAQISDKTCASLVIPDQNVRRHSIGTSSVASASIVERLQAIAAQSNQQQASNGEKKQDVPFTGSKENTSKTAGYRFNDGLPSRNGVVYANRGRGVQIRGRGVPLMHTGAKNMNKANPNRIQEKRTSNPDLAASFTCNAEVASKLKPLGNQSSPRRFSSDMRISDFGNFKESEKNSSTAQQTSTTHQVSDTIHQQSMQLPQAYNKGSLRILYWGKFSISAFEYTFPLTNKSFLVSKFRTKYEQPRPED